MGPGKPTYNISENGSGCCWWLFYGGFSAVGVEIILFKNQVPKWMKLKGFHRIGGFRESRTFQADTVGLHVNLLRVKSDIR